MLVLKIIAVILGIVGLVGCILPVIPGPPLSWVGLLLVFLTHPEGMTTSLLIVWLVITVVVTILDYVAPSWITKKTGGSKAAARGTLVGLILGLIFFPPWGMIVGSFLGALIAEVVVNGSEVADSVKPAFGSFLGFLLSTGLKLTASGVMLFYIFKFL
ncbi:MAG: DUF456 domain-containing protein [Bacteroidales bacterium]|jgi:uncharacterized protein YqgC (DUF456 family)|nr:DUF456 domain-containing protein [Bacteroidales bacterium]